MTMFTSQKLFLLFLITAISFSFAFGQEKKDKQTQAATLKRTTTKTENRKFSFGSSLTLLGAPFGSITIEGWNKSEVDITADIELTASTEEDLAMMAKVNGFHIIEDFNSMRILTVGMHDKAYMKKYAKNFPKRLLGQLWKVDYKIKVPANCDMEISAGKGAITLKGVEGAISLNAAESNVDLTLTGGYIRSTIGSGKVNINMASRGWRGVGTSIQLGAGEMILNLPTNFNAYINADVLRNGSLENNYPNLKPEKLTTATAKSIQGVAGTGGAPLKFVVGDGTLKINEQKQ